MTAAKRKNDDIRGKDQKLNEKKELKNLRYVCPKDFFDDLDLDEVVDGGGASPIR